MGIIEDLVSPAPYMMYLAIRTSSAYHKGQELRGTQYSWSSSVFYFGYLAFSYPASFLMVRLPLGKYLGATW